MISPRIYEGTAEEIAHQIQRSNITGRLRAILVSEDSILTPEDLPETLAERLKGRVGRFDFGDANLSEDTGKKFAEILAEKHAKGQP